MLTSVQDKNRFQEKLEASSSQDAAFRILVVDDELSILELVKTALETLEDYEVEIASSAMDALEIVMDADEPFDCFLLDVQMPEMDGIELLREIRNLPDCTDTPVLMLTAMSDRKYIDLAFLEGASDYVNKPFDFLELRSRIKCAHGLVEARRQTEQTARKASDLKDKLVHTQQFNFEDPFSIHGVDRILRYIEFDNYVAQLARRKLFNSQAFSIMLHDAELFFNLAGGSAFRSAIHDVAKCIERAISDFDCVFSYRGGGVFLAILHGRKNPESMIGPEGLGELVGAQMKQHISDERIEVIVGKPVSMRVLSRAGATDALHKAVSAVQQLEAELQKGDEYPDSFDMSDARPVQVKGQKRVYERVLHELFGEESYLSTR